MRFITEFELDVPYNAKFRDACINRHKLDIGHLISENFGWQKKAFKNMQGNNANRWSLEIEAFPMDKWIEFKNRLLGHISFCNDEDRPVDEIRVLQMIKDLEFYGKATETTK